jgi:two-component system chemotaxis response regulator CheY
MKGLAHVYALIVDDERDMRFILKMLLKGMGIHNIAEAHDGKHAIQILQTTHNAIDLVLCDWNMPGMTGIQLHEEISLIMTAPPFLIISGRGDHDSVVTARSAGVAGYIRKPFSPEQVETRVLQALQCSKS